MIAHVASGESATAASGRPAPDVDRAQKAVRELLIAFGEDPDGDGPADTPARVVRMYRELFFGLDRDPTVHLRRGFHERYDEIVLLRDVSFCSVCEHHLLPFVGKAHVAHLLSDRAVGLSKLARTVDAFSRRPQIQEQRTCQVADALMSCLKSPRCAGGP